MLRRVLLALAFALAAVPSAPAADNLDPKLDAARARLFEIVAAEDRPDERAKAVAEVAAFDTAPAARILAEALDKLAVRTAGVEERAAKTREDYAPYEGSAFKDKKEWEIKQRLLAQMEADDAVLRGDLQVEQAFTEAVAGLKDREAASVLDKALVKAEQVHVRRVLYPALLRNPTTKAGDLAKRAMADSDAPVRLSAVVAFASRKDPALTEFALKALADPSWPMREAAAKALAAQDDARGVAPLVMAMQTEQGRLLEDYADALTTLTGAKLGPNPDAWKRWLDDHKAELLAKGAKPPPPPKLKPGTGPLAPPVDYYGIETRSLRLLFLIDCSGSMNEVMTGEKTHAGAGETKIDIAKKMLKKAVMSLSPNTLFDVITFSGSARSMNGKMIQATADGKAKTCMAVDELVGRGETYTYGALRMAFGTAEAGATAADPQIDTIFLLSDGAPTEAETEDAAEAKPMDPEKILGAVRQWNEFAHVKIHTIAIDPRIEKNAQKFIRFMRDLAAQNGGTYTAIGEK